MAKVTLTIEDCEDDGKINIGIDFDPPAAKDVPLTAAQTAGFQFLDYLGATPDDITKREDA